MRDPGKWKIYHLVAAPRERYGLLVCQYKEKKEPCLRLGSPETESEPKIYLQEVYQGEFSGTTPVRK